jgi:hypothetical protein
VGPGRSLPVTFGIEENFWTEYLSLEVADFKLSYHAILGHPMLARFMAVPHYTYLVLKMSAPKGVLTVTVTCSSRSSAKARPMRSPR